jgi:hypothetical protein
MKNEDRTMNNEQVAMSKGRRAFALLFAILLFMAGCSNILLDKPRSREAPSSDIPEGFGTVAVSLNRGAARTVMPDPVELATLHLEYWFA